MTSGWQRLVITRMQTLAGHAKAPETSATLTAIVRGVHHNLDLHCRVSLCQHQLAVC